MSDDPVNYTASLDDNPSICAAMITFHPDSDVHDRIERWLSQVESLCVVDNGSPESSLFKIREMAQAGRITLIENSQNLGIATALNQAVRFATQGSFEWLLTLDQDSAPSPDYVEQQILVLKGLESPSRVGIIAGSIMESSIIQGHKIADGSGGGIRTQFAITSGSLHRTEVFHKIGGFREELFIDLVDTEFCLRLNENNYLIILSKKSILYHVFGNTSKGKILFFNFTKRIYSPTRNYYRYRNGVRLSMEWMTRRPAWSFARIWRLIRLLGNIIFLHDRKLENIKLISMGISDGFSGQLGPFRK